ncbi:GDSL-type esterase/lipase family protein [Frigoribacterium sp. PhB116]|uniref:GDSL-type esterase/lipase family protein n=1 Tax=Frigoribacterium sp. PhB116 TaxID=2485174 RepID=UPI00105C2AB2|nr:GDSL-type esterase/lipase family protein [Frigoribacterium sp. PhB116]TDT62713.1 GAF domain-containing protein [Frigoribacterium sp. PhB116]
MSTTTKTGDTGTDDAGPSGATGDRRDDVAGAAGRLLRSPVSAARYAWLRARASSTPRPRDVPFGAGAGVDPDRVLVVGAGPAVGWGVSSHDLALPGRVSRRLARRTGRGSHVAALAEATHRLPAVRAALDDVFLENWDVVVVTLGAADALTLRSPRPWARELDAVVVSLLARLRPCARVVVVSAPPGDALSTFGLRASAAAERHARLLSDAADEVCSAHARVTHLALPALPRLTQDGRAEEAPPAVDDATGRLYEQWADALSEHVAPLLHAQRARTDSPQKARSRPQPERVRLDAITASGLGQAEPTAALHDIADRAREAFSTDGAAFDLVLDDHQWAVVSTLGSARAMPLSESFCVTTIRSEEPFVVADAWAEGLELPRNDIRFYAGWPVHTADGTRIGALCVFDPQPRDVSGLQVERLREFALDVERELFRLAAA